MCDAYTTTLQKDTTHTHYVRHLGDAPPSETHTHTRRPHEIDKKHCKRHIQPHTTLSLTHCPTTCRTSISSAMKTRDPPNRASPEPSLSPV